MKRKYVALLLSALVLPGLGQLYLGQKGKGVAIIMLVNMILLVGLFVLLKGLSPVIANQIAGGAVSSSADVLKGMQGASPLAKGVLASFFVVWAFALVDVVKYREPPE